MPGTAAYIVFTTESGRILVNGALYKGQTITMVSFRMCWCRLSVALVQVGLEFEARGCADEEAEQCADCLDSGD
jgi:hypothetical protein